MFPATVIFLLSVLAWTAALALGGPFAALEQGAKIASLGSLILLLICILWARWSDRRPSRGLAQVRRPRRAGPWRHKPIDWAVIDGSNVLFWNAGVPSLDTVAAVVRQVQARGMEPVVWFDANVGYRVGSIWLGPWELSRALDLPRKRVFVAEKGQPADPCLLDDAQRRGARAVVSNDRYRDWAGQFDFLATPELLVRGGFGRDGAWLAAPAAEAAKAA